MNQQSKKGVRLLMTVRELIEELKKHDPDARVCIDHGEYTECVTEIYTAREINDYVIFR